jgi:hypothetical protein
MIRHSAACVVLVGVMLLLAAAPAASESLAASRVNLVDADVYEYAYRNWNNANTGAWSGMSLGTNVTGLPSTRRRVYIRFDIDPLRSRIAAGEKVFLDLSYALSEGDAALVNVYRVAEDWIEGEGLYHSGAVEPDARGGAISWSRQPAWDSQRVWSQHRFTRAERRANVDVTELCRAWATGQHPNRGLMMAAADETRGRFKLDIQSSESPHAELRPTISVGVGGGPAAGGSELTITYCDGSFQSVSLVQPAAGISGLDLGCGGRPGPGSASAARITYCDGSSQSVTLTRAGVGIRSVDFGCGGGQDPGTGSGGGGLSAGGTHAFPPSVWREHRTAEGVTHREGDMNCIQSMRPGGAWFSTRRPYDFARDYTVELEFKLVEKDNHWITLYSDGFVYIEVDWGLDLGHMQPGSPYDCKSVAKLELNRWHRLRVDARPWQGTFDLHLDGKLVSTATRMPQPPHKYHTASKRQSDPDVIFMGDADDLPDRGGNYNRGAGCWRNVRVTVR